MGQKGLLGIYGGEREAVIETPTQPNSAMLQPFAPPQIDLEVRTPRSEEPGRPARKKKKRVSAPKPENMEPHQLPVFMGDMSVLVFRSENKQLSKNGPDTQAILMMRCREGKLNVLLDFPGYPMSNTSSRRTISYDIDNRKEGRIGFSSSNQMSVIGIWKPSHARRFARELFDGSQVRISTTDTENTPVTARFSIDKQRGHASGFQQACGIV